MICDRYSLSFTLVLILFVNFVSSTIIYSNTQCVTETLDPCKRHPWYVQSVLCENINDIKTFVRVLRCSSKLNMQEVFLERSSLDFLPLYILDFCGFLFLNVKSVVLTKLLEGNVMIRLEQLKLEDVRFRGPWSWEPLGILRKLLRFSISNMDVKHLNATLLDNLSDNLQSFMLTSTNTETLSPNALEKFSNMEYISIENNAVSELKRSMFPTPAKIEFFYFGNNKVSFLPDDIFEDMPFLKRVGIEGNLISEIHLKTFNKVWNNLEILLLEGNPLKCHCKMLWLAKKKSPEVFTGECFAPKTKYGKALKSLSAADFHCY